MELASEDRRLMEAFVEREPYYDGGLALIGSHQGGAFRLSAAIERGPFFSPFVDHQLDRLVIDADATVTEDPLWPSRRASRCDVCGGPTISILVGFKYVHVSGCPSESESATARYRRKHPEKVVAFRRMRLLRQRIAVMQGRCGLCIREPAAGGFKYCDGCRESYQGAQKRRYAAERKAA